MPKNDDSEDIINRLRRLDRAATPGPWFYRVAGDWSSQNAVFVSRVDDALANSPDSEWPADRGDVIAITYLDSPTFATSARHEENAHLIVAIRNSLSGLCDAVDASARVMDDLIACLGDGSSESAALKRVRTIVEAHQASLAAWRRESAGE